MYSAKRFAQRNLISRNSLPQIIGLFIVMIVSVLVRVPFFEVPMISDEGGYAYVAHFWSNDYQLYRDIPFNRPQGIFLIYKLILNFFGKDIFSIRLSAALWNAITLVFLYIFSREVFGRYSAYVSALVFALFSTSPGIEGFTANAELFTILPLVVAAYFTWQKKWAWAGFLSGIAVLIKPIGISGLILALLWMLVIRISPKKTIKLLVAFAIPILASVLHGLLIDWNSIWSSFFDRGLHTITVVSISFRQQLTFLFLATLQTLPVWITPAILAVFGSRKAPYHGRLFGVLWIFSSLLGMAIGGNWYWHYFTQIIPPLAFLSGTIVFALKGSKWRYLQAAALGVALSVFVVREVPLWFLSPQEVSWEVYHRPGYMHAADISDYIISTTDQDDHIYIAFSEAEIYYLSQRRAAVPQLYWLEIVASQSIFEDVKFSIRNREPTLVILVQEPPPKKGSKKDFLGLLLQSGYHEDTHFGSIRVFRRN